MPLELDTPSLGTLNTCMHNDRPALISDAQRAVLAVSDRRLIRFRVFLIVATSASDEPMQLHALQWNCDPKEPQGKVEFECAYFVQLKERSRKWLKKEPKGS